MTIIAFLFARRLSGMGHLNLPAWLQRYGTAVDAQMRRKQFTTARKQMDSNF